MKKNIIYSRFSYLLLVLILVLSFNSVYAVDIVGYTLGSGTNGLSTSGVLAINPLGSSSIGAQGLTGVGYSSNGLTGASWDNNGSDGFKTTSFSTLGYLSTAVVGQIRGTSSGPKRLKAQYSLNNSTWLDVPNHTSYGDDNPELTITLSFASFRFRLPAECDNQASVYVRWIQDGTTSIGGGTVSSSGTISMQSVVMQADALSAPTSQSTQITIVSLTPTTITVGCTPGSGNRRYLVINTVNSFTAPSDDFIPSANAIYSGSGQQIIYVGSGTVSTVTVPSSLNTYWFRYYEFNQLNNLTRFSTIDASLSKNPKLCALPNIHTPTHNFGLIRATMGATINAVSGDVSAIIDRGVFWDYSPGITNNTPNMVQHSTAVTGTYVVNAEVDRGQTIYYRGYAENESGVILSSESSFNNTPIFTGTGTWETAARWNVQEVPGANGDPTYGSVDDSPVINGTCTLTQDNNVTNLTINASRRLTINKATTMRVNGTLTNSAGTSGILIKSIEDKNDAAENGSLIFANGTPQATVEMFSKAYYNTSNLPGSRYAWQYFGIPITTATYNAYFSIVEYVRAWDESVIDYYDVWVRRNNGTSLQLSGSNTLLPGLAYEISQNLNKKYSFAGTLNTADFSKTLQYSPTAYFKGQNLLSNPYTASMDIRQMQFGANTQAAVYLYNTGTYNDWFTSTGETTPGEGPGMYKVLTPGTAGDGGVAAEIAGMQGFIVKATAHPGSVSFSKSNLVPNTQKQRIKAVDTKMSTMIDLKSSKFSDRMWIFEMENATTGFDNGYDGPKMLGHENVSQLYGIGTDDIYQINVLNDLNEAFIGVQPGIESSFTLNFKHTNLDQKYMSVYLVDLVDNVTVDITADASVYSFTSNANDPVKRFKIIANTGGTTDVGVTKDANLMLYTNDNKIIVDNKLSFGGELSVFDTTGRVLSIFKVEGNTINTYQPNLNKGTYITRMIVGDKLISQPIIIK